MRFAAALPAALVLLAGCASPSDHDGGDGGHGMMMGPGTYHMRLSGMPSAPVAPGSMFNVTVQAEMGQGMGMMHGTSDHIGAHFWNRTVADPTAAAGNSTLCAHQGGSLPGTFTTRCTAPAAPGTYRLRSHSRMMDNGTMHNWWSDEQTFTVS